VQRGSIGRQVHLLEQRRVARISPDLAQQRIIFEVGEAAVVVLVGALQPLESPVDLAVLGIYLSDLVARERTAA